MLGWNNPMPIGQSWGERCGGLGRKGCLVREGHSSRCTDQWTTGIYSTRDLSQRRYSKLSTTRILVSRLATARVFALQPTGSGLPASQTFSPLRVSFLLLLPLGYLGVSYSTPPHRKLPPQAPQSILWRTVPVSHKGALTGVQGLGASLGVGKHGKISQKQTTVRYIPSYNTANPLIITRLPSCCTIDPAIIIPPQSCPVVPPSFSNTRLMFGGNTSLPRASTGISLVGERVNEQTIHTSSPITAFSTIP